MSVTVGVGRRSRTAKRRWTPWVLLVLGLLVLGYPTLAGFIEDARQGAVITEYRSSTLTDTQQEARDQAIGEYNAALEAGRFNTETDPWAQGAAASNSTYLGTGEALFILRIPKLGLELPVFYGTTDVILAKGAGLLENTSYPGTTGGHGVISAHRGTYNQDMFRHLDLLGIGDAFYIEDHGQQLKYVVTSTMIVKPNETGVIEQRTGHDLVTLLTCDPFPLNTHRLLVFAERAPLDPAELAAASAGEAASGTGVDAPKPDLAAGLPLPQIEAFDWRPLLTGVGLPAGLALLVLLFVVLRRRRRDEALDETSD